MPIDFTETRLELGVNYGVVGGLGFKTEITEKADGQEQRNSLWSQPLGRWQLGQKRLLESDIENINEVEYLRQFYAARKGSFEGFRFKDWCDFEAIGRYIGTGDGAKTEWQLIKTYQAGEATFYRPITKPVEGTVKIYVDGVDVGLDPDNDWFVNNTNGLITKETPLSAGKIITADFEFDVPVVFENEDISWELMGYDSQTKEAIYELGSVTVKEIRVKLPFPLPLSPITEINQALDLGINYQTSEAIKYNNYSSELSSGWVNKYQNSTVSSTTININSKVLNKNQFINLLGYFYCARGSYQAFNLNYLDRVIRVRFKNDSLSVKFEATNFSDYIFVVDNLEFVEARPVDLHVISSKFSFTFNSNGAGIDFYIPIFCPELVENWEDPEVWLNSKESGLVKLGNAKSVLLTIYDGTQNATVEVVGNKKFKSDVIDKHDDIYGTAIVKLIWVK